MDVHTDWLSFTLPVKVDPRGHAQLYDTARRKLMEVSKAHETYIFDGQPFDPSLSRPPYGVALAREDNGVRVFGSSPTQTVLYELAGRACEGLREQESSRRFIAPIVDRLTRWDLAVDIRTGTRPTDFSNARNHRSFRSVSYIQSDTGETCYVGSPKSDRFCRVYRYNPPHPRADTLRVEFVFRRGLARTAALRFTECQDQSKFVAELGNTWGWSHADWRPGVETDERVRVPIATRDNQDTVFWLYHQVAPALRRLLAEGAIDITDFLAYVYEEPAEQEAT